MSAGQLKAARIAKLEKALVDMVGLVTMCRVYPTLQAPSNRCGGACSACAALMQARAALGLEKQ